jgi:hypothetical protein
MAIPEGMAIYLKKIVINGKRAGYLAYLNRSLKKSYRNVIFLVFSPATYLFLLVSWFYGN